MNNTLWVGLDVGSTTVKIAIIDPINKKLLHGDYQRHNANQAGMVTRLLTEAHEKFPDSDFRLAFCGSAGEPFSRVSGAFFIQEVVANALAIKEFHPEVRIAIELGGQDAKVVFFRRDELTGQLLANDMRMNGSCAGGTGAFIDQIAELLRIKTEDFNALAAQGSTVHDISGRCGVFAKTDIQPLLNQGVPRADIALSCFHALVKQTIGGLAQGMEITPPIIFEGGPLTFNPVLIDVFRQRLNLDAYQIIHTEHPELIVAIGAALSTESMFGDKEGAYDGVKSLDALAHFQAQSSFVSRSAGLRFFANQKEREDFHQRYPVKTWKAASYPPGTVLKAWLGIDGGSTTTKFVLLDDQHRVLDKFYASNQGEPLQVLKNSLLEVRNRFRDLGVQLDIQACGTTGYGENLFARALKADYHTVETVAHAQAAKSLDPDASFILDIGGQDMKAIFVKNAVVTGIVLNEACSAGCGSFLETYARSLKIPVEQIAELSFGAENPSKLGSRCTVFMNSSIITEQKAGKTSGEIVAGLCRSVIENVFTKVVRVSNLEALGTKVIVQGGTFKNDAVLRAFEQYFGKEVIRPEFPGEMGAIGIAMLTKAYVEKQRKEHGSFESSFIGLDSLESFSWTNTTGNICHFCANNCNRTVVSFTDGATYITGNRCEKGEILGDAKDPGIRGRLKEVAHKLDSIPDLMKIHRELLMKDWPIRQVSQHYNLTIGIPRVLEFWTSMPFWRTLFRSLGMTVKVSKKSSYEQFEKGLHNIPSDTACFPAKLSHGHIQDLIEQGVDRIFMPMMANTPVENKKTRASYTCPLIQGYPEVIDKSDDPSGRHSIPFDHPIFFWWDLKHKEKQVIEWLVSKLDIAPGHARAAYLQAEKAFDEARLSMETEGAKVLSNLDHQRGGKNFGVVLAGRPYHNDELVNHNLSTHFTRLGIPVLTLESLGDIHNQDIRGSRMDAYNAYHTRMIAAAFHVAKNPGLELVQIVSFGCGHDAILSDEMIRILREKSGKEMLILKLDEGENAGPLGIRVKSFVETIRSRRENESEAVLDNPDQVPAYKPIGDPFSVKFMKSDRKKTILIPNLSRSFSRVIARVIELEGFNTRTMELADERAIELGKKYVHNDICFPAQINVGEILRTLEKGDLDPSLAVAGLAKNCKDCRAGHYALLARKALDDAGFPDMPIITTGDDDKDLHPGFTLSPMFQIRMVWGLAMIDALESMVRRIRPYELVKGSTDLAWAEMLEEIVIAVEKPGKACKAVIRKAVERFNALEADRSIPRPRVGILGEILLNFHPSSNSNVEAYLEHHGMEVVLPSMSDFFRRDHFANIKKDKRGYLPDDFFLPIISQVADRVFTHVHDEMATITAAFKYAPPAFSLRDLARNIEGLVDELYMPGEGWLMAGEIIELAKDGVDSFVILNPFGCLPNHITGRGFIKPIKKRLPHIQILSLDFDPDTAFANVENRLQMLVITARELNKRHSIPVRPEDMDADQEIP